MYTLFRCHTLWHLIRDYTDCPCLSVLILRVNAVTVAAIVKIYLPDNGKYTLMYREVREVSHYLGSTLGL